MPIVFVAAIDGLARIQARAARRRARAASAGPQANPPWGKAWAAKKEAAAARGWDLAARSQDVAARSYDMAATAGPPGAAPPARAASRPGGRVTRYAVAMAAAAALLALGFPLARLWSPATYQITPHVRAEREALTLVPAGTTVESTLTTLAPLAARDTAYWIGTAGNPAPRYIVFDADNSGYAQPPANVPGFINGRYPGVTYQMTYKSDGVYVFLRTTGRDGRR